MFSDYILNTCKELLRDKVREGLVDISALKMGGLLILKLILNVVMTVEGLALRLIDKSIQRLRMKDITGENVGTLVSYLKGVLLLIENCANMPIYMLGLLNDIMMLATNIKYCIYMMSMYYEYQGIK